MKNLILILATIIFMGCARVQTLNLEAHKYSNRPDHIVWIQIAGFSEEHLPLLKFNSSNTNTKSLLESSDCVGKMWNYNLYKLRPKANESFLSQMTGSKNIKNNCEDAKLTPVWKYAKEIGHDIAILEAGVDKSSSLESMLGCSNNSMLNLERDHFYKMSQASNDQFFHYQDSKEISSKRLKPGLYFDRSCQKGSCFSTLGNNFRVLWEQFSKERNKTFFLVRDFNFQNALNKKDISLMREALLEVERMLKATKDIVGKDTLILVTGAESVGLEFPNQGMDWVNFERTGKNLLYKNSSLMSPAFATGAMAENFCGIFDESDLQKRILFKPEDKVFNIDNVLPF